MEADYRRLKAEWRKGNRERENALQLMFFAWMHWAEPSNVTGMEDDLDAHQIWLAIFDQFGGEDSFDPEFLYVASLMAEIAPWGIIAPRGRGVEHMWNTCATRMTERALELKSEGFLPENFEGRGGYGEYFAHHTRP